MQGYRAALLRFLPDDTMERIDDALVVVDQGRIADVGAFAAVAARFPQLDWVDWRGRVLAPGFIDVHVHFPQLDVIGSPAEGLLPWLENYTFPHEARFADPAYASAMAELFLDELLRNGVTTAMVYCSSHAASAEAFFEAAQKRSLRMVAGKCLMDRNSPEPVRDDTRRGLAQSQFLIERWHGRDRLGYAITPRFAPSCSDEQMRGAAELAEAFAGTWVQTHVAENRDEIAWVAQLFPDARSYLDVYDRLGLLRERSMFAPLHPSGRGRSCPPDGQRRQRRGLPDLQSVPGQRPVRLQGRRAGGLSVGAGQRRRRGHVVLSVSDHAGRLRGRPPGRRHAVAAGAVVPPRSARRGRWGWTAWSAT